jgi:predicted nucleic acid-binding protein
MARVLDRSPHGGATRGLNVYVDSSVLLRVVLREPGRVPIWSKITTAISSELIRLECLRTIDRARVRVGFDDPRIARYRADILEAVDSFDLIALDGTVLARASDPFPTLLGSLDAIHLASARLMREEVDDLVFATHDEELGVAAHATGFDVHGINLRRAR